MATFKMFRTTLATKEDFGCGGELDFNQNDVAFADFPGGFLQVHKTDPELLVFMRQNEDRCKTTLTGD